MAWAGRIFSAVVFGVAAGAIVVGWLMPREIAVARIVDIAAPTAALLPLVGDLRRFAEWSPWFEAEGDVVVTFPVPDEGIGQSVDWASTPPAAIAGHAAITRIDGERVEMALDLGGLGPAVAWFAFGGDGPMTRVSWGVRTDLGPNPFAHYLGARIDAMLGRDIERGLLRLKAIAEAQPAIG